MRKRERVGEREGDRDDRIFNNFYKKLGEL